MMFRRPSSETQKSEHQTQLVMPTVAQTPKKPLIQPTSQATVPPRSPIAAPSTVKAPVAQTNETSRPMTTNKGDITMNETTNETVGIETETTTNATAPKKNLEIPMAARRPAMPGFGAPNAGLMGFGQAPTQSATPVQTTQAGYGHNSGAQLDPNMKRLVIGEGISISGEINSCDYLVIEGSVKSDFKGSSRLDISETGVFKGSAETKDADIAGEFDGTLIVNGRLTVRSGGKIKGTIHYQELAVEAGSVIEGKLNFITDEKTSAAPKKKTTKKEDDSNVTQMTLATAE